MSELLIELFSEEIPSNLQINARRQLEKLLSANLISLNLNYKSLKKGCLEMYMNNQWYSLKQIRNNNKLDVTI